MADQSLIHLETFPGCERLPAVRTSGRVPFRENQTQRQQ